MSMIEDLNIINTDTKLEIPKEVLEKAKIVVASVNNNIKGRMI